MHFAQQPSARARDKYINTFRIMGPFHHETHNKMNYWIFYVYQKHCAAAYHARRYGAEKGMKNGFLPEDIAET